MYEGLYRRVGRRKISRFLENLARPHVVDADLEAAYREMASDQIATASKSRLQDQMGRLSDADLVAVERAMGTQLDL